MAVLRKTFAVVGSVWGKINVGPNFEYPIEDLDYDLPFSNIVTFAHLPWERCFNLKHDSAFDIAVLGFPFDTTVSVKPGARYGPRGIRSGSTKEKPGRTYNVNYGLDWHQNWARIIDCGDVPVTPYDNAHAYKQMEQGYRMLLHKPVTQTSSSPPSLDKVTHPRLISMGGDHSIMLPILRSLKSVYGPISVIHFDSHLDSLNPTKGYSGVVSEQSQFTHGTFFWHAAQEGCIANSSVHGGLRTKLFSPADYANDAEVGFSLIHARDIDDIGVQGIIDKIRAAVGESMAYISVDIDVLDPSAAPATGAPEAGGWTTREFKRILEGIKDLNVVGADVVEVAPDYDTNAEITSIAAADIIVDVISAMVEKGPLGGSSGSSGRDEL
ncbi:arginase family-domain-containing protein [Exophiala viscosa]|uniref:Arginase family-domain-containing protein n=1 Tax=Exophiala viscosa TaxID=2486360 RepID=A0AAN6DZ76_9EURO|nr:arginase family-domain-containing protein [Exophiala viscosa]